MNTPKDKKHTLGITTPTHGYIDVYQKREIWKGAAKKFNGDFKIGHNSGNAIEMLRLEIPYKKCLIKISESDTRPLKFRFELNFTRKFNFNISWEDTVEKILKVFGKQDIIIGEDKFDRRFLIQSNNADLLKIVLSDSEIRNLILKHNIYSLICEYNKKKKKHSYLCVVNRTTETIETFSELIDLQLMLIDKFIKTRLLK